MRTLVLLRIKEFFLERCCGLLRFSNQAHSHRRNARLFADSLGEWDLIARVDLQILLWNGTATRGANIVAAKLLELPGKFNGLFDVPAARSPIRSGNTHADRLIVGPHIANGFEDF